MEQYIEIDGQHLSHDAVREKVAVLEAEVERLRVCGNCGHRRWEGLCQWDDELSEEFDDWGSDHCHFAPSRWTAREDGGDE